MTTDRLQFNGEAPTVRSGRQLFLDGGTVDNAERFRRMTRDDPEQVAYFTWEVESLTLFGETLIPRVGPPVGCTARRANGLVCWGPVGEMGDGRLKCVTCGAVQAVQA